MHYILDRDHKLLSVNGCIEFNKGEPTWVPPALVREAISIGARALDGETPHPLGEEKEQAPEPSAEDRARALTEAFDLLVDENDPASFTGQGVPTIKAIEKLTNMSFDKGEVGAAWREYRIAKDAV